MAKAAVMAVERGADFIDLNLGCPLDAITRRGGGAVLLERPRRVGEIVATLRAAVEVPISIKVRTGWRDEKPTAIPVARAAVDAGADAIIVHGRSRAQRYRRPTDWAFIGEVRAAVEVPVIGNGDIAGPADLNEKRALSGCDGVKVARAALVKPWIFGELREGVVRDLSSRERCRS